MLNDKAILVTGAAGGIGRATAAAAPARARAWPWPTSTRGRAGNGVADHRGRRHGPGAARGRQRVERRRRHGRRGGRPLRPARRRIQQRRDCPMAVRCGIPEVGEISEEAFARIMQINVTGTWLCMRAELEHMRQHGGGAIVNASPSPASSAAPARVPTARASMPSTA